MKYKSFLAFFTDLTECQRQYRNQATHLIRTVPDLGEQILSLLPACAPPSGHFAAQQCNETADVCRCVARESGEGIPGKVAGYDVTGNNVTGYFNPQLNCEGK